LQDKKAVYRRHGVQEYIVWQVFDHKISWFYLDNDRYVDLEPGEDGLCRSRVFPGLWLDREAMLRCKALRYWRWCSRGYNPQSTKLLLID
jgi:Uma2 family endonuclease